MEVRGRAISPPASLWPSWHRMPFQLLGHQDVPDGRPSVEFNEEARLYCLSGQFGVAVCLFAISRRPVHSLLHHPPPLESMRERRAEVGRMRGRIEACAGLITVAEGASEPLVPTPSLVDPSPAYRAKGAGIAEEEGGGRGLAGLIRDLTQLLQQARSEPSPNPLRGG
jgi:hypothetical protein